MIDLLPGQINSIMGSLSDDLYDGDSMVITESFATTKKWGKDPHPMLKELIGYRVELTMDGDHRDDGQIVDYSFKFISPSGEESEVNTEMCLMVGFNHHEVVTIK